jgi:signal transduction histidine kinase
MATVMSDHVPGLTQAGARPGPPFNPAQTSLEAVERRRLQLWTVVLGILFAITLTMVMLSLWDGASVGSWFSTPVGSIAVLVLVVSFCAYVVEKELALRKLTRRLIHQQVEVSQSDLSRRVAELLDVNRMKSEFVATVSHELRTPLTSILGSVITIRSLDLDRRQQDEFLDTIERQGQRLLRLIEELLTTARLEMERDRSLSPRAVDLNALVRMVARDLELARQPIEVTAPAECEVVSDPDILQQVLVNLIDNAHKHGKPPVRVAVESMGDRVLMSVIDAGSGVPPAERERIFERFVRLDSTGSQPGMGLGLPIVRDLLTACGGTIWLEQAATGGAAFRVTLPSRGSARA